jgi:hypothetical protein
MFISERTEVDTEALLEPDELLGLAVPDDLGPVIWAIDEYESNDPVARFEEAQSELDRIVAVILGLADDELEFVLRALREDGFLKQVRPMYAYRGFREQPYADHSGQDRYA